MKNGNSKRNKPEYNYSPFSLKNTQSTGIRSNKSNPKKKIVIKKSVPVNKQKIKEKESEKEKVKENEKIILKEKDKIKEKKNLKKLIPDDNSNNIISPDIFKDNILNTKSNLNTIPISFGKDDLLPKEFFQDDIVSGSSFIISDIQMPNIKIENKISIPVQNLINELILSENIRNTILNCINRKRICLKTGKIIFNTFRDELYNNDFLFYYTNHRCSRIICKPHIVFQNKKLYKSKSQIYENNTVKKTTSKLLDKEIKIQSPRKIQELKINLNLNNNEEQTNLNKAVPSLLDTSTITNAIAKDINDNTTVKIEKRQSLFPTNNTAFHLTKIPQKTQENTENVRLNIAYNKAKDAARVVRRLEYSYSMRVNILLSKPIFQKNARIIQNWYRSMKFIKMNTPKIVKIQAFVRGMMIRKAFKEVLALYQYYLPFLKVVDKILSRRYAKIFFDKLTSRYGIRILIKLAKIKCRKIINAFKKYHRKMDFLRKNYSVSTKLKKKCVFTRNIFEWLTRLKLMKLQSHIKRYLMHNNEKIILKYTNEYNPKLYYYLKYGKNKYLLKKKLKKFREMIIKLKEMQIRIKFKKLGINNIRNKYDYFKYIIRKRVFNILKKCYKDSINNKSRKYQRKVKLRILLNRMNRNNNKRILKKYFLKWNLYANYLTEYRNFLKADKLLLIQTIMKYHKKFREKVFMLLMNRIKENRIKNEKDASKKIFRIYKNHNGKEYINNNLLRIIKKWKRKAKFISLNNAANIINRNSRLFLSRKKIKKKYNLINLLKIRNKIFKEKLRLWKFNSGRLKRNFNNFIIRTLRIIKMRKIFNSLEKKKKNILKKYFERFQVNTGVKKLLYINFQMCLYDENKKPIVNDKYSVMQYIKGQENISQEELKNKMTLKAIFSFWKSKKKYEEFKNKCQHRIIAKCKSNQNILKSKFVRWNKIAKKEKMKNANIIDSQDEKYNNKK